MKKGKEINKQTCQFAAMPDIEAILGSEPGAFSAIRRLSDRGKEESYQAGNSLYRYLWYLRGRISLLEGSCASGVVHGSNYAVEDGDTQDSVASMFLNSVGGSETELEERRLECLRYVSQSTMGLIEGFCEISRENRRVNGDRAAITTLLNYLLMYNAALAVPR